MSAHPELAPLRVKSEYSLGEAIGSPSELVRRAHELGLRVLGLTDVETLAGAVEFHDACRTYGIKPITGVELRLSPAPGADSLVALARGARGYRALCRIVTSIARSRSDRMAALVRHFDDLLVLASSQSTLRALLDAGVPADDVGLLVNRATPASALEAARERHVPAVFDGEVVMPRDSDRALFSLSCKIFARRRRERRNPALTAAPLGQEPPSGFDFANARFAARCELDLLDGHAVRSARASDAEEAAALEQLCALCHQRRAPSPAHAERLRVELDVLATMRLASYVMSAYAVFDEARRRGISILTRGSAVSSLVVHTLGLSPIDPLVNGLFFERFVRSTRKDPPDIDLELASARRDELLSWLLGHFGARAAPVAAYSRFRRRSAYREGLLALGMSRVEVERFARALGDEELEIPAPLALLPPQIAERAAVVERLIGRVSHLSTHPSGMLVAACAISDFAALERAPKSVAVTQFDGSSLGRLGLPKLDLLGNHALSELEEVAGWIGRDPSPAGLDDAQTLSLIGRAHTVGCHQLETPAMRALLCQLPISSFEDIVAALALIRPAAAGGEAKRRYVALRRGEAGIALEDRALAALLPTSYGIVLYEEDVIRLIAALLKTDAAEADALRQAIVDGEELGPTFVARATANGASLHVAEVVWNAISRFAAYSFSKAHATSAAWLAYRSAHAKANHLPAFGCALLNHHAGAYPLRSIGADLVRSGLRLLPPDVNRSHAPCTLESDAVRTGLARISGLDAASCERLLAERSRGGPFRNYSDLTARVALPESARQALVLAGACDELEPLSKASYPLAHYALLGQSSQPQPGPLDARVRQKLELWQRLVRVQNELRYLGLHVSDHPMALLRPEARRVGCLTSTEVAANAPARVRFAGITSALRRVRQGSKVADFVTFEDEFGLLEAVVKSRDDELARVIETPGPYLVDGVARREWGCTWLEVNELIPFYRRPDPYGA